MRRRIVLGGLLGLGLVATGVLAATPRTLAVQGRVTDPGGNPIDGNASVAISLYTTDSGGTALATEVDVVTATDGVFVTTFGDQAALDPGDFRQALWVGIAIEGGAEQTPRTPLRGAPYALAAGVAERTAFEVQDAAFTSGSSETLAVQAATIVKVSATSGGATYTLDLPDPTAASNVGRVLHVVSASSPGVGTVTFSPAPNGCSGWAPGVQRLLVSDGVVWQCR